MMFRRMGHALAGAAILFALAGAAHADDWLILNCRSSQGDVPGPGDIRDDLFPGSGYISIRRVDETRIEVRFFYPEQHMWGHRDCSSSSVRCRYTLTIIEVEHDENDEGRWYATETFRINRVDGSYHYAENYRSTSRDAEWEDRGVCSRSEDPAAQVPVTAF